jgi:hypothetical protein
MQGTRSFECDRDPAHRRRQLDAGLAAGQLQDHAGLVVLQLHAACTCCQRAARADYAVSSLDVGWASQAQRLPVEVRGRRPDGEADARASDPEPIMTPFKRQDAAAASNAYDDTAFGEDHMDPVSASPEKVKQGRIQTERTRKRQQTGPCT